MNVLMLAHCVTAVFVVLKLAAITEIATWSWWMVFMPSILAFGVGFFILLILVLIAFASSK